MNANQQKGYDFTKGCVFCLARYFLIAWFFIAAFNFARNYFAWGIDDSDAGGFVRSGLTVHTDAKTGIQYLSDGKGGLIRRERR